MRPMLVKTFVTFVSVLSLFFAGGASALVTVSATTAVVGPVNVGDFVDVDVLLTWDGGSTTLTGIFTSTGWSNTQLALDSAIFPPNTSFESRPAVLKGGFYDPSLTRTGPLIVDGFLGDDLSNTARSVQYSSTSALNPLSSSVKTNELVTRLTFEVIGVGDGFAEVVNFIGFGDEVTGDSVAFSSSVSIEIVPEPVSVLLALSSLASVLAVTALRQRH